MLPFTNGDKGLTSHLSCMLALWKTMRHPCNDFLSFDVLYLEGFVLWKYLLLLMPLDFYHAAGDNEPSMYNENVTYKLGFKIMGGGGKATICVVTRQSILSAPSLEVGGLLKLRPPAQASSPSPRYPMKHINNLQRDI